MSRRFSLPALCILLLACTRNEPAPPVEPPLSPIEQQVFDGQNMERQKLGLVALILDPRLVSAARRRAQEGAVEGKLSHESASGTTAFTILTAEKFKYSKAAENLARNSADEYEAGATAVVGFLESQGHRDAMLDPEFTRTGIGAVIGTDGLTYFAVIYTSL